MPIITSIKPQKNKRRVSIYLDNKFGFGVDLENLMRNSLKVGKELSDETISKIVNESEFQSTYDKILKFAVIRPRSKKEYDIWLKKHRVHKTLHKELFNRLKRLEMLDDSKFAIWWVEQRQNFRPKSKKILNQELRIKGIDKEIIKSVLDKVKIDELKVAKELVDKKKYRWEKLCDFETRKKMSQFLLRRGFGWDVIKKVIDNG